VGYIGLYFFWYSAILVSRVSEFNVEPNMVAYWFVDENKVKRFVTLHVFEFIDCLVRFIPDKNLKLIRCYGLYSRCTVGVLLESVCSFSREKVSVVRKRVVVCCPNCGKVMDLAGVSRPDGGGGLVYDVWDDDYDYADW
jgi:hypothetical protein